MITITMRKITDYCKSGCAFLLGLLLVTSCNSSTQETNTATTKASADSTAAEIKLPPGFTATIVADSLGAVRHLALNKNGDLYVKLGALKDGKGIYYLTDTNHDGMYDTKTGFGNYPGTGMRYVNDIELRINAEQPAFNGTNQVILLTNIGCKGY